MHHGPIETSAHYIGYCATWYDYDGAEDASYFQSVIGNGKTRQAAIRDLLDNTENNDEEDERLAEYAEYLAERDECLAEDAAKSARKERLLGALNQ